MKVTERQSLQNYTNTHTTNVTYKLNIYLLCSLAMLCISAGYAVVRCLSVRLVSDTLVYCRETSIVGLSIFSNFLYFQVAMYSSFFRTKPYDNILTHIHLEGVECTWG